MENYWFVKKKCKMLRISLNFLFNFKYKTIKLSNFVNTKKLHFKLNIKIILLNISLYI